jgi:hypothetical protein
MNDHDPRPLVEVSDAPEALREALAVARADAPSADRLAALAARLPLGAHLPPGPGKAGPGAAPAAPSVLSGALVGAALGVVVSGAGLFWDSQRTTPASPPSVAASPTSAPKLELPPAAADPKRSPAPRAPVLEVKPSAALAPRGSPAPAVSSGEAAPSASPLAEAAVPNVAGGGNDDRSETDLLESARNRVGANPGEALSLTQEHAVKFPRGALSQERELLAIQALLALGRADEARARRDRFVSAYPGSAHKRRLDALFAPSP